MSIADNTKLIALAEFVNKEMNKSEFYLRMEIDTELNVICFFFDSHASPSIYYTKIINLIQELLKQGDAKRAMQLATEVSSNGHFMEKYA